MWTGFVFTAIALVILRLIYEARRDHKLPPGPRRLPFIGNMHQAPTSAPWRTYHKWFEQYGPLISLQLGGTTVIVIGSASIAHELLDKRGHIYSNRPRLVMAGECLTKGMHIMLRQYDERFLLHQRLDAPILSPRASATYYPLQDLESKQLLVSLLATAGTPLNPSPLFDLYSYSVVYMAAYGIRITPTSPSHLHAAKLILSNFSYAAQVGTWAVDALPFLNFLPEPLAPWKKTANRLFATESRLHTTNTAAALASRSWNWTKELHASPEARSIPSLELAYNVGVLVDAGLETTATVLAVFVLACLTPHGASFVPRARAELDDVVGPGRLPTLADRDALPYVRACAEETLRWRHIVPGGVPHAVAREDAYGGYRIPAGATVLPAYWTVNLDEEAVGGRPGAFRPERWLEGGRGEEGRVFGFGRRVCAGRHVARNSVFLLVARLLWAFEIGGTGGEVDDMAFGTEGFVSKPEGFEAVFRVRGAGRREVVEREWGRQEKDVDVLMDGVRERLVEAGVKVRG